MQTSFSTKGIPVAIIPDGDVGECTARMPDMPAYGEGEIEQEAIIDLTEALAGRSETFGTDDALSRVRLPSRVLFVHWTLEDLSHASVAASFGNADGSFASATGMCPCAYPRQPSLLSKREATHLRARAWESAAANRYASQYCKRCRMSPMDFAQKL